MDKRRKLSAFVLVQNVEDIIEDCLESIRWVDEIFIVDAFSTDRTLEICRRYPNVRIVQHEYENSGAQRAWGMPQVAHEWVLIVDSDERCTPQLRQEVECILSLDEIPFDGYNVHIRTWFFGRLLRHSTYLGSGGKRLVRRELHKTYVLKRVHAKLKFDKLSLISNRKAYLVHVTIRDFGANWNKMIRYATWAAEDMWDEGKKVRWYHLSVRPLVKFLQYYTIRGGFLDGMRGLIVCVLGGIWVFMKYYKLFEMRAKGASQ